MKTFAVIGVTTVLVFFAISASPAASLDRVRIGSSSIGVSPNKSGPELSLRADSHLPAKAMVGN